MKYLQQTQKAKPAYRNLTFVLCLMLVCFGFLTCDFENQIIETWWQDDFDYDYVAIIKDVPILVYQTIVEDHYIYEYIYVQLPPEVKIEYVYVPGETIVVEKPVPPEVLMEYIKIVDIQFIIFAGESVTFNGRPGQGGTTPLTSQEFASNASIVNYLSDALEDNPGDSDTGEGKYFLILHGHANPISSATDAADLENISSSRANSVRNAVAYVYDYETLPLPPIGLDEIPVIGDNHDLSGRMTAKGYGGGHSLSGPTSTYAGLNRRVEAILFTVEIESKPTPDSQR